MDLGSTVDETEDALRATEMIFSAGTTVDGAQLFKPARRHKSAYLRVPPGWIATGRRVEFCLTVLDKAGRTSVSREASSPMDLRPAITLAVVDVAPDGGPGVDLLEHEFADISVTHHSDMFAMRWKPWEAKRSPYAAILGPIMVAAVYCAFGTRPGLDDIVGWHKLPVDAFECRAIATEHHPFSGTTADWAGGGRHPTVDWMALTLARNPTIQHLSQLWVTVMAENSVHILAASSSILGRFDLRGPIVGWRFHSGSE